MYINKEVLRDQLRERRCSLSCMERSVYSESICTTALTCINGNETIMTYVAKELEVGTIPLIKELLSRMVPIIVPIIIPRDKSLKLSYVTDISDLVPSTFQVPEPVGKEIPAPSEEITTAFIPMLGFDRNGSRLGYGAGYFDRFLSRNRHIKKIGLAFSCQEMVFLPVYRNDICMDMVITEKEIIIPGKRHSWQ